MDKTFTAKSMLITFVIGTVLVGVLTANARTRAYEAEVELAAWKAQYTAEEKLLIESVRSMAILKRSVEGGKKQIFELEKEVKDDAAAYAEQRAVAVNLVEDIVNGSGSDTP